MPIINYKEKAHEMSPLGEFLAEVANYRIKEKLFIGDTPCPHRPEEHEGIYYVNTGECWECDIRKKHGVEAILALRTFLDPDFDPFRFKQFIGTPDFDDHSDIYYGSTCKRCGTNRRFLEHDICLFCSGMRVAELEGIDAMRAWMLRPSHPVPMTRAWDMFVRKVARADGHSVYEGRVCEKHPKHKTRYTLRGQCTKCVGDINRERHRRETASIEIQKPALVKTKTDFDFLFD
jgi:hypothetical protein